MATQHERRDSMGPISIGQALAVTSPATNSLPTSHGNARQSLDMLDRAEILTLTAARFRGAGQASTAAEKQKIGFLVEDTAGIPLPILKAALERGRATKWKFMPTASEIYDECKDDLAHERSMARIAERFPPVVAAPALPPPPVIPLDIAKANEWGKPLGIQWDASGRMIRTEKRSDRVKFEDRVAPTERPQVADYAEIRGAIAERIPAVSDVSPALKALQRAMADG